MRPEDTEMIANICSLERMEAAINEFQPFKAPGPDELYPVQLQKGRNLLKGYYRVVFKACPRHSYVPLAWQEARLAVRYDTVRRYGTVRLNFC